MFELVVTVILMLISLAYYMAGYKHNQIPYFLQTLSFLGLTFRDDKHPKVANYLYNFRFSYYDFGNLLSKVIPEGYL